MQKNILLSIIAFSISIKLFSQTEPFREKKIYAGIFASPDLSLPVQYDEISKLSYTFGGEALWQLNSRISLSLGILYSVKSIKTTTKTNLIYQTSSPTQPIKVDFIYNVSYLELPLRIDFYLSKRKIAPFITTGVSTNVYLRDQTKSTASYQDGSKKSTYQIVPPDFQG